MAASSKPRSQGGGRTANSEPRLQVFRDFAGCNFQLAPRDFSLTANPGQEQSDLQMNYMVLQNNAEITDNKTIETRNNITVIKNNTNQEYTFTGPSIIIGNYIYAALSDGNIQYFTTADTSATNMLFKNEDGTASTAAHTWKDFLYVDDQLIATTSEGNIWTGTVNSSGICNTLYITKKIPNQTWPQSNVPGTGVSWDYYADPDHNSSWVVIDEDNDPSTTADQYIPIYMVPKRNLNISGTYDSTNFPYRVTMYFTYVNKFGPTKLSKGITFYANKPVSEWNSKQYLYLEGVFPPSVSGIKAVEFYFTTGDASSPILFGRVDDSEFGKVTHGNYVVDWSFNWTGYLTSTDKWPAASKMPPAENYTSGVHASYLTVIDGRIYFWGNSSKPYRLWIGGNPGNLLSVNPGVGGGYVDVEPGSDKEIRVVTKYKTQGGNSIVTMLCDSKNSSKEERFNLVENTISLTAEQSMRSWQAEQVAGSVGCKSFHGALVCEDGLYSVSRYGLALTTMTMEYNSQIRANYVSDAIKPAFTDKYGTGFDNAILLECDGVLYLSFANDNMLFCYDIDLKSWWTVTIGESTEIIKGMFNFDYEGRREGIGIILDKRIVRLSTTRDDAPSTAPTYDVLLQTGELSTQIPMQGWFYLSQMEFRFDYFIGFVDVELTGIDQFGRKVVTKKRISHDGVQYNLAEYMRVDLRLQSYQIRITGTARFRLTHFMSKLYVMSNKQGLVWGFNDSQTFRSDGDIHPTFLDYNDIRKAIIP